MKKISAYILAGVLLVLAACATTSTKISSSWKRPETSPRLQRVLLIGVAPSHEGRVMFESDFAEKLRGHGVTAYPSYAIFTSTGIPNKATVVQAMRERNIDSVLITRLVEEKDVSQYVPPSGFSSAGPFYSSWYGYYGSVYNYSPGYTIEEKVVVLQTNLYDAAEESLVWSATSDTTTQGSKAEVVKSFISAMIEKMQDDKLIK